MYDRILIATDGSELAQKGVDHGLSLAKQLGSKVVIVMATDPFPIDAGMGAGMVWAPLPRDIEGYEAAQKNLADGILSKVESLATGYDIGIETRHVARVRPAEAILDTARAEGCSLIVMASHGRRGLGRLLLGSQTSEVLSHSKIPVLVVR